MLRVTSSAILASALLIGCSSNNRDQPARAAASSTPASSAAFSSAPASSAATPTGVVELVSGVSLGPVRIGMDRAELSALGLPVQPTIVGDLDVGPYNIFLRDGRVALIDVDLDKIPAVRVNGQVFKAGAGTTIRTIASSLPRCGPLRQREGADAILCDAARTELIQGRVGVSLEVNGPAFAAEKLESDRQSYGTP